MKRKIVHIVEAFGGGVYSFLVDLVNKTIDYYNITIIYTTRAQTPSDFKRDFDKRVRFIKSKYLTRNIGFNDIKALKEIKNIIKNENPDIVHCHSSKAGIIGRFSTNTKKIKTFYTPHGYSFLMKDSSILRRSIYKILEKIGTINNSTIIACSKGEYEESLKLTKKATYVSNGINLEMLKEYINEDLKPIDIQNMTIVTVGRISYQKNPTMFNTIANEFKNIKFIWIGNGEMENELTSENIEITGWKSKNELLQIVNKSDIFILTSLWEGLSISLLEAMALKKPCIVSNVIGNRDVITNEQNGFVCNTLDDFISTIQKIQDDKYDLKKVSQNAYEDILKIYNTEVMSKEYLRIYEGE